MQEIKVSVIVPIYNTEKFLRKCIESILNQTLKEIEIILINDGSIDNSHAICKEYSKKFSQKIRYINNPNIGCSATRNLGIRLAQGEYIAFVDSDDYIEKEMYQEMYDEAKKQNLDVVISGIRVIYSTTNKVICSYPKKIVKKYDYLKKENAMTYCYNKLYKKEQIMKNNLYFPTETHYAEDLYFSFLNLIIAKNIGHIEKCYYNYILHGKNSIYNLDKRLGVFISFNKLHNYLLEKKYFCNSSIKKLFYDIFNEAAIKMIFFTLLNDNLVSNRKYKKYDKLFYKELKKINFLPLKSKILIYYYRSLVWGIRTFRLYEELKKIKNGIKRKR